MIILRTVSRSASSVSLSGSARVSRAALAFDDVVSDQ